MKRCPVCGLEFEFGLASHIDGSDPCRVTMKERIREAAESPVKLNDNPSDVEVTKR